MTTTVALLRGVNVGGHRKVSMADLRQWLSDLGMTAPRSLVQSGNLVFGGAAVRGRQLEAMLEDEARNRLELETEFFVRTAGEWKAIVAANPFPEEAGRDPAHLHVMFFREKVRPEDAASLQALIKGPELVRAGRREAYLVYPEGMGRSRLTGALIEKTLGGRGTARNWNTILGLAKLLHE